MPQPLFPTQPCNRRSFVIASSLFIAGTVVSCSESPDNKTVTIITPPKPILPDVIRVRIGKNKNGERVTIGSSSYHRTNGKWKGVTTKDEQTVTLENIQSTKVIIGKVTKVITGAIVLYARDDVSDDAFDVIAHVPLEKYLPGVLAGELFAHWHPETFAAQAVAARSYVASQHLQRKNKSHYDVTDGPSSQMFLGDVSLDVSHRAVNDTKGVVLTWDNAIIPAYYSACCGGLAATATDAISEASIHDIPPLQGHDGEDLCNTLDIHKWTTTRPSRIFRKRIQAASLTMKFNSLKRLRTIRSIEPALKNVYGRPITLAIIDRKNQAFEIRTRDFIRVANAHIASLPRPTQQIWSPFLVGNNIGSSIEFQGVGMGHGVGLCQYGAQELAGQGMSWEDILAWYYPKSSLTA